MIIYVACTHTVTRGQVYLDIAILQPVQVNMLHVKAVVKLIVQLDITVQVVIKFIILYKVAQQLAVTKNVYLGPFHLLGHLLVLPVLAAKQLVEIIVLALAATVQVM